MPKHKTLQHTEWDCKYHVIFIPKYRRKVLYRRFGENWKTCSDAWLVRRRARSRKGI